jgi:hypothetical protein
MVLESFKTSTVMHMFNPFMKALQVMLTLLTTFICSPAFGQQSISENLEGNGFPLTGWETENHLINKLPNTLGTTAYAYYVKANAPAGGSGSSWATAFKSVAVAMALASPKDTIRVAKGEYREQIVLKDSVVLLGGYPNIGNPADSERNWGTNPTILSGENGNIAFPSDNRPNILSGVGISAQTRVDGFIIQAAYTSASNLGGCITLVNASPQISNCVFRNNFSSTIGVGGSAVLGTGGNPQFNRCFFVENEDVYYGTVHLRQGANAAFNNCVFFSNRGNNVVYSNQSVAVIKHCSFIKNQTRFGYYIDTLRYPPVLAQNGANLTLANSIFFSNIANGNNGVNLDTLDVQSLNATVTIVNCITQNHNTGNPLLDGVNPKLKDTSNVTGPDNFYFTDDDGLQLINPCSPAINIGNSTYSNGIGPDILGKPRIFNAIPDLGAYEVQAILGNTPTTLYVKAGATGTNDGSSWANAFTSLQTALQYCSDTIKVAAGSYSASTNNPGSSFWLENKRIILGGYPNLGNPTDAVRNPVLNPTTLSAILPIGSNIRSFAIIQARRVDSTAILDGFTISGVPGQSVYKAAMLLSANANPIVRNTVFTNNISGFTAGALIVEGSSKPFFYACTFEKNGGFNVEFTKLGAVYNTGNATPIFRKCTFRENSTWVGNVSPFYGGAITNVNASPIIDSCFFIKNVANNYGGAIANFSNSNPVITNSGFYGNKAANTASDIYNNASSPQVSNCIFADSSGTVDGGIIANLNGSNPSFFKCQFKNGNAANNGGSIYNDASSPTFNQCLFTGSKASAGGVFFNKNNSQPLVVNTLALNNNASSGGSFMHNSASRPIVVNSTFIKNSVGSTVTYNGSVFSNTDATVATIKNCIIWSNDGIKGPELNALDYDITNDNNTPSAIVTNTFTRIWGSNGVNGNFVGIDPRFLDINNPAGLDGIFFTADDGVALCACSPGINQGADAAIAGYATDFLNNSRTVGGTVDIGAIEFQSTSTTAPQAFYVKEFATGLNTGLSWQDAYPSLQRAIQNPCADTIKVAQGIYKPAQNNRDSSFFVNRKIVLLGGYPNSGNPADSQRNPLIHRTILSGDIGVVGDSLDNTYNIMLVQNDDTTVVIDGVVFARANGNSVNAKRTGALTVNYNKNLMISNCRFENNYAVSGSAIFSKGKVVVDACVFENNKSFNGTFYLHSNDQPTNYPIVKNSVFQNNTAEKGGAVYAVITSRFENVVFYGNAASFGGGVYLDNNPEATFINCDFVRNNSLFRIVGIGLYNNNGYFTSQPKPKLRNCIFYENMFFGTPVTNDNSDWAWYNGNSLSDQALDIKNSAILSGVPYETTNIPSSRVVFRSVLNPRGFDGIWFTADDGLQVDKCSRTINTGDNNAAVSITKDITGNPRIKNISIDMGPYEYQATTPDYILTRANDSLVANVERTDNNGWTHYYKDCELLLSIKKGNQQNIGYVGFAPFRVVVKTTPLYGTGNATNLSSALYVTPGVNWYAMNRYWKINTAVPLTDSLLVRIPFTNTDFNDVNGTGSSLQGPQKMVFFALDTALNPLSNGIPANVFKPYYNGTLPTTTQWRFTTNDTINYAEFYVKKLYGGGGGTGTGNNGGPQSLVSSGCDNGIRVLTASTTGFSFQWQVNTGTGYVNVADDSYHGGSNTSVLNITNPPTFWYGRKYRCLVNGVVPSIFYTILFESLWTGTVDNNWENPLNWSCGKAPDNFTDVIINSGTVIINSNVIINSLQLNNGVNFSISPGNSLTILR